MSSFINVAVLLAALVTVICGLGKGCLFVHQHLKRQRLIKRIAAEHKRPPAAGYLTIREREEPPYRRSAPF